MKLCRAAGLFPVQEYKFAKETMGRNWRNDFYFESNGVRVALEVEGGVWTKGRHTRGTGFLKDMEKYNALSLHGIFLLRVVPDELCKKSTIDMLKRVLNI